MYWQDRNVVFGKVGMPLQFQRDRSHSFLARTVLRAAEPVKASLRRAQNRRAALTEPLEAEQQFS
jgi:hypothetical protein